MFWGVYMYVWTSVCVCLSQRTTLEPWMSFISCLPCFSEKGLSLSLSVSILELYQIGSLVGQQASRIYLSLPFQWCHYKNVLHAWFSLCVFRDWTQVLMTAWFYQISYFLSSQLLLLTYFGDLRLLSVFGWTVPNTRIHQYPIHSVDAVHWFQNHWLGWIKTLWTFFNKHYCGHVFLSLWYVAVTFLSHIDLNFTKLAPCLQNDYLTVLPTSSIGEL